MLGDIDMPLVGEDDTEVARVFELLSQLKARQPVEFDNRNAPESRWRVNFTGTPSFRHANRIGIFRDFLDGLLPGSMETVGGELGSVVVHFAPQEDVDDAYITSSKQLATEIDNFTEIAGFLGISSLEFGDEKLVF